MLKDLQNRNVDMCQCPDLNSTSLISFPKINDNLKLEIEDSGIYINSRNIRKTRVLRVSI